MSSQAEKLVPDLAERLHSAPSRQLSFYLVLLVAVLPVWSVVPLSWAFVIYTLHSGFVWSFTWRGWGLFALALCEVFFSVYHYNLFAFVSKPRPTTPVNIPDLQRIFQRVLRSGLASLPEDGYDEESLDVDRPGSPEEALEVLEFDDPRAADFRNSLRPWFRKAPWSSIRRHEVYTWLHWSIFNAPFTSLEQLPPAHQAALQDALQMLEGRAGATFPEGSNPAATPFLLTLDPVNVAWRPLLWYASVTLGNTFLRRRIASKWRATVATYKDLEYVLRMPPAWDARTGPRPIVLMHGLGLGLAQYYAFIELLYVALPDHPILVPLFPHVSQEILHHRYLRPLGRHEMVEHMYELMVELGWVASELPGAEDSSEASSGDPQVRGVTMLSHSNGSFAHAWMLKAHPKMITRSCFVDPVTFCSWEGDLCYNFVYKPCSNGLDLIVKYFVGTELGVANFLQRHFDWSSNTLWYEEIPHARDPMRTRFYLGGKDSIIDAYRVKRYLTSHGVRHGLHFHPDYQHGQSLLSSSPSFQGILTWLGES